MWYIYDGIIKKKIVKFWRHCVKIELNALGNNMLIIVNCVGNLDLKIKVYCTAVEAFHNTAVILFTVNICVCNILIKLTTFLPHILSAN